MTKPTIGLQELRAKIGDRAKSTPTHRFWGLYVHISKLETLESAYREAKRNGGAPGSDGTTFEDIENAGLRGFLTDLSEELQNGTYQPLPYRRKEIPKEGNKVRVISIPAIRDRVVQGAVRLVLEPMFEADFSDCSYGARPRRSAHGALGKVRQGLRQRKLLVVDVDLARYFDNIRHDRMLSKVAERVQDGQVLRLIKQFLKRAGARGRPQGSPLSPLLANLALNNLDHALERGEGFLIYVRYLDDMIVLVPDSEKGRRWADRALERIRLEAESIGVNINREKTRIVRMGLRDATFAFLGFDFRWKRSPKTGRWYPYLSPRRKKVIDVLRRVRATLRKSRHLETREAIRQVNGIVRGWVNYFRVGNSAVALGKVRYHVERQVRRLMARKRSRRGFGWRRWSSDVVYGTWGLFDDYKVRYLDPAKVGR